jgi:glutathionylspermidine synthase
LLGSSETTLCNPASVIISQSKRFPLVWGELPIRMPTWEAMLPKTFDVRDVAKSGLAPESLVFKPIFGRVGDMIKMHGLTAEKELRKINRSIRWHPRMWIAQERFEAVPLSTPSGNVFPCVGIYTLDGNVIGAYGRIARRPLIDHLAQDAAVLIAEPVALPIQNQTIHDEPIRTLQTVGA